MSPLAALSQGIRTLCRARRMVVVYWLWTVAFALAVALPASALLFRNLGHSLYAVRMLDNFDLQWVLEFLNQTRGWPGVAMAPAALIVAFAFLLAGTFLAGGALRTFQDPDPGYVPAVFYQGCGRNFGRLFWLLLLSVPFYLLLLAVNAALNALANKIWGEGMEAHPLILAAWFRTAILLLLALAVNMVFDYAKIHAVAADVRNPWRSLCAAARVVRHSPGRASGLYLFVFGLALALGAVYLGISNFLPRGHMAWLLLVFTLQQAYVAARLWTRLLFFSSQTRMYESLTAVEPEPEPPVFDQVLPEEGVTL